MTWRVSVVALVVALAALTGCNSGKQTTLVPTKPTWPGLGPGAPYTISQGTPPDFPTHVDGYAPGDFHGRMTVRIFSQVDWTTLDDFPATQNGCDQQQFYVRWRALHPGTKIEAALISSGREVMDGKPVVGTAGWMSSYGCEQPAFRLPAGGTGDGSTLSDVVVEVQQWAAAV